MEHITRFERGHNCKDFECINGSARCKPGSGGFHGAHGLQIRFIAKGEHGAVQFLLYTDWYPVPKSDEYMPVKWGGEFGALPADLGYHSKTPRYEGQSVGQEACEYCDGAPCYYDGSGLNANIAMQALVNGGDEGLWQFLDAFYECTFNNKEFPEPAAYPKPIRKP